MKEPLRLKKKSSVKYRERERSKESGVMLRPFTQRTMRALAMNMITLVATLTRTTTRNPSVSLKLLLVQEPCILQATNLLVTMRSLSMLPWVTIKGDLEIQTRSKSEREDSTEARSHLSMPIIPRRAVDTRTAVISCN